MVTAYQYEIYIVNLDPTQGSEIAKTRPCVVISPDEMNQHLRTVQVAPLTSNTRSYPWRVPMSFRGRGSMVALDQIRTIDSTRLLRKVGRASPGAVEKIRKIVHEMLVI